MSSCVLLVFSFLGLGMESPDTPNTSGFLGSMDVTCFTVPRTRPLEYGNKVSHTMHSDRLSLSCLPPITHKRRPRNLISESLLGRHSVFTPSTGKLP